MRIAIVTETYPPEVNGVALTVQALARGLEEDGHAVQLVRPKPQPVLHESAVDDDVHVPGAALPRYPGLRFGWPAARRLERLWNARRPDAIYVATEGPLGFSALRAARRLRIAACTGFHTRFDDFARHYGIGLFAPLVFAYLRRFHRRAAATLVPTDELVRFLREHDFGDVRLLRRAVDTQLFDPAMRDHALRHELGLAPDDLSVIYVGRIAPEKNLQLGIDAFRRLQRTQPRAKYVFVGEGPARDAIAAANPDFRFVGVQRGRDLARHFASADLFLFASRSETFGNVTLEAMASGVATVAYDYGAAREFVQDGVNGRCIPCDDAGAFVDAAMQLADDASLRRRLGQAARESVLGSNPRTVTAQFAALLASLQREAIA
jgi:glycosyltransferase involved in cell wall biosynthesis